MVWKRLVEIDNYQKRLEDKKKPKGNSIERKHKKRPKIEVIHTPDRFDLDIVRITAR